MSLIFYYAPWSSSVPVTWALEELQIPHERVKIDLKANGTRTPEFLALNPNGKVPLIVHDGVPIFEGIAIIAHLGETFGVEKKLFPAPGLERAQALQWLAWAKVSLGSAAYQYLNNTSEQIPEELRNAKLAASGKAEVELLLGIFDRALAGKTWLVGDTFTLVDAYVAALLAWLATTGLVTTAYPSADAWLTRCKARPAFAAAVAP